MRGSFPTSAIANFALLAVLLLFPALLEDDAPNAPDSLVELEMGDGTQAADMIEASGNQIVNGLDGAHMLGMSAESDGAVINGGAGTDTIDYNTSVEGGGLTLSSGAGDDVVTHLTLDFTSENLDSLTIDGGDGSVAGTVRLLGTTALTDTKLAIRNRSAAATP